MTATCALTRSCSRRVQPRQGVGAYREPAQRASLLPAPLRLLELGDVENDPVMNQGRRPVPHHFTRSEQTTARRASLRGNRRNGSP